MSTPGGTSNQRPPKKQFSKAAFAIKPGSIDTLAQIDNFKVTAKTEIKDRRSGSFNQQQNHLQPPNHGNMHPHYNPNTYNPAMVMTGYPYPNINTGDHGFMPNISGYNHMPLQTQTFGNYPTHSVPAQFVPQSTAAGGIYAQNSPGSFPTGSVYNGATQYGMSNSAAFYPSSNPSLMSNNMTPINMSQNSSSAGDSGVATSFFPSQVTHTSVAVSDTPVMTASAEAAPTGEDDFSDFAQFEIVKERVQSPRSDNSDEFQDFSSFATPDKKLTDNCADEFQAFAEPISCPVNRASPAVNIFPQPPTSTVSEKSFVGKRVNIITKNGSSISAVNYGQDILITRPPKQAPVDTTKKSRASSINKELVNLSQTLADASRQLSEVKPPPEEEVKDFTILQQVASSTGPSLSDRSWSPIVTANPDGNFSLPNTINKLDELFPKCSVKRENSGEFGDTPSTSTNFVALPPSVSVPPPPSTVSAGIHDDDEFGDFGGIAPPTAANSAASNAATAAPSVQNGDDEFDDFSAFKSPQTSTNSTELDTTTATSASAAANTTTPKPIGHSVNWTAYDKLGDLFKDVDGGDDLADFSVFTPDVKLSSEPTTSAAQLPDSCGTDPFFMADQMKEQVTQAPGDSHMTDAGTKEEAETDDWAEFQTNEQQATEQKFEANFEDNDWNDFTSVPSAAPDVFNSASMAVINDSSSDTSSLAHVKPYEPDNISSDWSFKDNTSQQYLDDSRTQSPQLHTAEPVEHSRKKSIPSSPIDDFMKPFTPPPLPEASETHEASFFGFDGTPEEGESKTQTLTSVFGNEDQKANEFQASSQKDHKSSLDDQLDDFGADFFQFNSDSAEKSDTNGHSKVNKNLVTEQKFSPPPFDDYQDFSFSPSIEIKNKAAGMSLSAAAHQTSLGSPTYSDDFKAFSPPPLDNYKDSSSSVFDMINNFPSGSQAFNTPQGNTLDTPELEPVFIQDNEITDKKTASEPKTEVNYQLSRQESHDSAPPFSPPPLSTDPPKTGELSDSEFDSNWATFSGFDEEDKHKNSIEAVSHDEDDKIGDISVRFSPPPFSPSSDVEDDNWSFTQPSYDQVETSLQDTKQVSISASNIDLLTANSTTQMPNSTKSCPDFATIQVETKRDETSDSLEIPWSTSFPDQEKEEQLPPLREGDACEGKEKSHSDSEEETSEPALTSKVEIDGDISSVATKQEGDTDFSLFSAANVGEDEEWCFKSPDEVQTSELSPVPSPAVSPSLQDAQDKGDIAEEEDGFGDFGNAFEAESLPDKHITEEDNKLEDDDFGDFGNIPEETEQPTPAEIKQPAEIKDEADEDFGDFGDSDGFQDFEEESDVTPAAPPSAAPPSAGTPQATLDKVQKLVDTIFQSTHDSSNLSTYCLSERLAQCDRWKSLTDREMSSSYHIQWDATKIRSCLLNTINIPHSQFMHGAAVNLQPVRLHSSTTSSSYQVSSQNSWDLNSGSSGNSYMNQESLL